MNKKDYEKYYKFAQKDKVRLASELNEWKILATKLINFINDITYEDSSEHKKGQQLIIEFRKLNNEVDDE